MRVIVLGAGVVGVCSAWYLSRAGHEVVVVERQAAAAMETSFANGGQISVSHAEPWAGPQVAGQLLSWIGHEASPLLWRLRLDPAQWRWGLRFLAQCTARRAIANTEALVRLGLYSHEQLRVLRNDLGLEYDQLARGILRIYTSARELDHATSLSSVYDELGCRREPKSVAQCLAIEPSLAFSAIPIVGGLYAPDDESGDARKFTQQLVARCAGQGVGFRFDASIAALLAGPGGIAGVALAGGEVIRGDAYVVALGSYTPLLLKRVGIRLPIYPAKGYSLTVPLAPGEAAPVVSLTDDEHRIVLSRLGDTLRIAGTAEFAGYDTTVNAARCDAIAARVRALFPGLSHLDTATRWAGLRPATPGNVPIIGRTRFQNLYVNSGHGTLGWTLACGSGQLLADIVSGRVPALDPGPYRP